jgi:flagellar protein FlbT
MNLSLKAGDKLYINGGVIRVDRRVTIELLNNMTFLLGNHVLQAGDASTPLKQIYFVLQTMLMDPGAAAGAMPLARGLIDSALRTFEDGGVLKTLKMVDELTVGGQWFEAMKQLRGRFPAEAAIMAGATDERRGNAA